MGSTSAYALIAALPVEFAAIQAMLDQPFPSIQDGIKYVLGRIGQHTVVATLLTHMGNNFAAIGATKVIRVFPSIKDLLMVGIAAGVPQPGDVQLGDIVVSDKGGVVQHDNVKRTDGKIEIRDTSQRPSAHLTRAVREMQTLAIQGVTLGGTAGSGDSGRV
jgi:nucleoside phosphorylase